MGLLERVSTLIRANLNDMIDRAEDPEKMIKQVIVDMENQYLQVKTQVAVSIADQHMLEKKFQEHQDTAKDWMRKAELAVDKDEDDLARAALERMQTSQRMAQSFQEQVNDQSAQVETLKGALIKLEQKLDEAKSKRELLLARHRRSVAMGKAAQRPIRTRHAIKERCVRSPEGSRKSQRSRSERRSGNGHRRNGRAPRAPRTRHRSGAPLSELKNRRQLTAGSSVQQLMNAVIRGESLCAAKKTVWSATPRLTNRS